MQRSPGSATHIPSLASHDKLTTEPPSGPHSLLRKLSLLPSTPACSVSLFACFSVFVEQNRYRAGWRTGCTQLSCRLITLSPQGPSFPRPGAQPVPRLAGSALAVPLPSPPRNVLTLRSPLSRPLPKAASSVFSRVAPTLSEHALIALIALRSSKVTVGVPAVAQWLKNP